mmetsp:Transcript_20824/g.24607  ORF Transcript_20824/g.24607 Transcript_20824/m.24607 type:complete len:283 (+) Transcript_20824:64-912(+)
MDFDQLLTILDRIIPPLANAAARIRQIFFNVFEARVPFPLLRGLMSPSITHILSFLASIYLIGAVLLTTKEFNLFAFHPILMTIGCVFLMSEGFLVYRNGSLVSIFDPIMAGTSKAKTRAIHIFLQVMSILFMLVGLIFIVANKLRHGKSIVPSTPHACVGLLAVFFVIVQGIIGPVKTASSVPIYRWHGNSGKLTYDTCILAVLLGAFSFLPFTALNVGAEVSVLLLWLSSELQHSLGERKSSDASTAIATSSHDENKVDVDSEVLIGASTMSPRKIQDIA